LRQAGAQLPAETYLGTLQPSAGHDLPPLLQQSHSISVMPETQAAVGSVVAELARGGRHGPPEEAFHAVWGAWGTV